MDAPEHNVTGAPARSVVTARVATPGNRRPEFRVVGDDCRRPRAPRRDGGGQRARRRVARTIRFGPRRRVAHVAGACDSAHARRQARLLGHLGERQRGGLRSRAAFGTARRAAGRRRRRGLVTCRTRQEALAQRRRRTSTARATADRSRLKCWTLGVPRGRLLSRRRSRSSSATADLTLVGSSSAHRAHDPHQRHAASREGPR